MLSVIIPGGEVSAHIVGFNNREDHGQEGVELANDKTLTGQNGSRRVIRDRLGHVIEEMWTHEPVPGKDLHLSIDSRISTSLIQLFVMLLRNTRQRLGRWLWLTQLPVKFWLWSVGRI